MSQARLSAYLEGGVPPGGNAANPGAHDPTPPRRSVPVDLPGALYFAGDSPQWHGGVAFYDHDGEGGPTAARAYLITAHQFADIAAQEMYRIPQQGDPSSRSSSTASTADATMSDPGTTRRWWRWAGSKGCRC